MKRRTDLARKLATAAFLSLLLAGGLCWGAEKKPAKKTTESKPKPVAKASVAKASTATPPKKATDAPKAKTPTPAAPAKAVNDETRKQAQGTYDEALQAFQKGDLTAAKQGLLKVLEVAPQNAPALLNLASIEQRQREFSSAERHLRTILRDDPENASAWLLLGIAAYEQDKVEAAHAHLAQAVLYAPKNAQAHQWLGVVFGRKRWYSAGEEELRQAIDLDPRNPDGHYNLAVLYLERIPPAVELARRHYQRALELGAPPDPEVVKKLDTP